ncbi:TIGR02281 family clan AA aspartic protease [Rhizobium glycinendophyticum]|uniref:TIGR02281 family clan AA aspartic protease n=2 Tax=Rhizobium glycinendophyticum TaxID=2589807 RepID=A0A504UX87_9HYPH|nr:TIGR02281 family clan AA aspartic protease [Rhizobium glycinendophyticum]
MRFVLGLAILGIGLVLLVINHDQGRTFGVDNEAVGRIVVALPILLMISSSILLGRRSLGQGLRQMLIWVLIALALVTGYLYRDDMRTIGERVLAGLLPGRAVSVRTDDGTTEVVIHKSLGGHFETSVDIGPVSVPVLIDTGASSVVLKFEDAVRIGIDPNTLQFTRTVLTANGQAQAAPIRLPELRLGDIRRTDVPAVVLEQGRLDQSLLGMSFLSTLGSLQMQTDELRLRD